MTVMPGKRLSTRFRIRIAKPAPVIFPLLCPVEELKWIPGWKYEMIYSESGRNENNCIFAEYMTGPHFFGTEYTEASIWTTTRYDETNHVIHFLIVNACMMIKLELELIALDELVSEVMWSMTATSFNEKGNSLMNEEIAHRMNLMLVFLSTLLKKYCENNSV